MENTMKTKSLTIVLLLATAFALQAQDFETRKNAFAKSYEYETSGDYEKAIQSMKSIYQEDGYEVNVRLGWLSYLAGSFQESSSYYNKAINLMPYAIEPRFGLVLPASAIGNWDVVLNQYAKILEINPNNSLALFRVGMIYYGRNEFDKARDYFAKVVNLYPFDYDGLVMLAWSHLRLGNSREAKVLFQKALYRTPDGASALEGLASIK